MDILDFLGRCHSHDKMQTKRWRLVSCSSFHHLIKKLQGEITLVLGRFGNKSSPC
jgi:hypothetical protein